jgi:hypothetical protein
MTRIDYYLARELFLTQTHTSPIEEYQVTFGTTQETQAQLALHS